MLVLIQDASENNFSHWLLDILPRLKIFEENYSIKEIDYFLLPELKYSFHHETLEILNIPFNKILSDKQNRHIEADILFVTDHPWYKKGFLHDEMVNIPEWIVKWISNSFINHGKQFNCNEKIFIDRSESSFSHCQFINNTEIINFLENEGFTSYKVGQLSFQKQVYLFNNAKIIIGAHGAAFANLAFCKKNTKIIEIKPKNHPNFVDQHISKIKELDFNLIETGELINKDENGDIILDTTDLKKFL